MRARGLAPGVSTILSAQAQAAGTDPRPQRPSPCEQGFPGGPRQEKREGGTQHLRVPHISVPAQALGPLAQRLAHG